MNFHQKENTHAHLITFSPGPKSTRMATATQTLYKRAKLLTYRKEFSGSNKMPPSFLPSHVTTHNNDSSPSYQDEFDFDWDKLSVA